jgi:hypothetical protein
MNLRDELKFNIAESAELLHYIFPNYPDVSGGQAVPDLWAFLSQSRASRTV